MPLVPPLMLVALASAEPPPLPPPTPGRPVLMNIDFDGGHQILAGPPSTVQGTRAMIRAFFRFLLSTGRAREEVP